MGWDDMDLVKVTGRYPTTGLYQTDVNLSGRSGRAVLYTVWQASHTDQPYYLCSDINIGGGTTTPTPTPDADGHPDPDADPHADADPDADADRHARRRPRRPPAGRCVHGHGPGGQHLERRLRR